MNVLSSVGIVILAMVIMASLQLLPGVFALFYHYALGKYGESKASTLSLFFIIGAEIASAFLFMSTFYIAYAFFFSNLNPRNNVLTWILIGILISLFAISFFFYYRKPHSKDTELFIPRSFANSLNLRAKSIKTPSDAFVLGALSNVYELPLTLPLYLVTSIEIMHMHTEYFADDLLTMIYILVTIIPLFLIYYLYRSGHNLADIQKSRVRDKTFHRFLISFSYLTIAILIICFRII